MTRLGCLVLGLGFLCVACGSSSSEVAGGGGGGGAAGAAGATGAAGASGLGGSDGTAFITGDVDGVTVRGEMKARAYWFQGLQQGSIGVEAQAPDWTWYLVITNSSTVANACGSGYAQIIKAGTTTEGFASFKTGATCTVKLTHAAPNVGDVLEGTFSGTWLAITGSGTKTITNGRFRVPRIADGTPAP